MFKDGHRWLKMVSGHRCSKMFKDVHRPSQMVTGVHDVIISMSTWADVHRSSQVRRDGHCHHLNVQVGTSTWLQHFLTLADLPEDEEELIQHRLHAEVCHIVT